MNQTGRRVSRAAGAALASLVLTSCGSTVQMSGQVAAGGGLSGDGSLATSTAPSSSAVSSGGTAGGQGLTVGSGGTSPAGSGGVAGSSGAAPGGSTGTASGGGGTGSTTTVLRHVLVGAWVAGSGYDKAAANLGIKGLAIGNQSNQVQAMVNEINAHGGLLGAKVDLVLHVTKTTSTNTQSQEAQAVCDDFTQDHHAQFVISGLGEPTGLLAKCLAARGVPLINDDLAVDSGYVASLSHHLFLPSDWVLDRLMRTQIDALAQQGFFKGPGKVGILLYDSSASQKVLQQVVIPRLAALGVKAPDSYALKSDGSDYEAESGVVLKFQADGVNRIITIACSPLGFMLNATSQHYHPRYAVYTTMAPGALLETAAPKDQLEGAVGFGWSPAYDVNPGHDPGPVSPNQTRCWTVMKKAGEDTSGTAGALQLWFCDAFWFLQKALSTSGQVSAAGLVAGARSMRGYVSPVTWRTDLSSGRPDGVSAYRDLAYKSACSCFVYTSGLKPASS